MYRRVGLSAALAALLSIGAGASQATAGEALIGDLIGLAPVEVRARLTGAPADAPLTRGFEVAAGGGADAYLTLHELVADPGMLRRQAIWRTYGDGPFDPDPTICRSRLTTASGEPPVGDPVLVFRDGRLAAVLRPAPTPAKPPAPPLKNRKAREHWVRQSRLSPFVAAFGRLPLEDGPAFLARWSSGAADPADRLSAACAPLARPTAPEKPAERTRLSNSDMQGLALLPFAVKLPAMNRDRERARERGAATLAGLSVGQRLPQEPRAFARGEGMRWHGSTRANYGVLTVDLGGWKSRNLSDKRDAALVGIEDGVVTWISPPGGAGPGASLLCVDAEGQAGAPRPGCWGWGNYRP